MFENCSVRPLEFDDLATVLCWRNHPSVRSFMFSRHEIEMDEHRAWYARVNMDETRKLLIVQEDQIPLGFVQLSNVSYGSVADWGFYVRPDAPKGSGLKLGWAALEHAFEEFGLHKVCGQAIESNHASIAFHKKLGFKQEGVLREQQRIEDAYHALICFGLLRREWQPALLIQENTHAPN